MTDTPGNTGGQGNTGNTDVPSLEELARRLLDLWQDQIAAAAANPDLASQTARLMAAMPLPGMWLGQMGQMGQMGLGTGGAQPAAGKDLADAWFEFAKNWMHPTDKEGHSDGSRNSGTAGTAGPAKAGAAASAAAHQPGSVDLDELRARLAGLEKRLGELGGDGDPIQPTKRKPKTSGSGHARAGTGPRKSRPARPDDGTAG